MSQTQGSLESRRVVTKDEFAIIEGNRFSDIILMIFFAISLTTLGAGIAAIFFIKNGSDWITIIMLSAFGFFLTWRLWLSLRRRGKPIVILHKAGVNLPGFDRLILWQDVKNIIIFRKHFLFIPLSWEISFFFKGDFNQKFIKSQRYGTKYFPKHKQLLLLVLGIKDHLTAEDINQIINYYSSAEN